MSLILLVVLVSPTFAAEPEKSDKPFEPVGLWLGSLELGPLKLRLAFQIDKDKDGKLTGKLISLDQNNAIVPIKTITFADDKLTLALPEIGAKYSGKVNEKKDGFTGDFEQAELKTKLELKRIEKLPKTNRPQHPKPPFGYSTEDVVFENPNGKHKLAGTLTLPKGDGPFPVAVMVSGSGPQDRDETLFDHKPFLVIADHLTKAGIAVLRYDDRGVGKSTGEHDGATSADFATDAHAAILYLKTRKEIDPKKIGIIGHSEGGLIGPMVAAEHPGDVGFLVLLAGPGIPGKELLGMQQKDLILASGGSEKDVVQNKKMFERMLPILLGPDKLEDAKKKLAEEFDKFAEEIKDEKDKKDFIKTKKLLLGRLGDQWLRYFLASEPAKSLEKVKCPILALNGEKDLQVRAKENLEAIRLAGEKAGNKAVVVKELPELNHLFQKCKTGKLDEYGEIEETINPAALKVMTDWLAQFQKK